ncbi:MAG: AbrB/MazE/SpoVT family DNA-binding domain-containing protein [Clostridia bacterium]|nr:AbrB/MazE/SpoVT family DNA-binding domain-containing protein [Clostridia bacterium]
MKSTGVVRNIDQVGRFVIPMELRRTMGLLDPSTTLEVFTEDDDKIILRKHSPCCVFCNELDDLIELNGKQVCKKCIDKLVTLSK